MKKKERKNEMKKILMILMAICFMTIALVGCGGTGIVPSGAAGDVEPHPMPEVDPEDGANDLIIDEDNNLPGENDGPFFGEAGLPEFISVTGIIVSIEIINDLTHVEIEDADGNTAILVLNEETVFPFSTDFAVGDEVTGWYCANSPMIMIYPPQYAIEVFVSHMDDDKNIAVDRFHAWGEDGMGQMISSDEMFVFTTDENTEIILQDGEDFSDGDLNNRRIVVIYGMSTRSIPEQAVAEKLIVLYEGVMPLG